jgi:KDO2-lipid IV(A) lauroyltransferase
VRKSFKRILRFCALAIVFLPLQWLPLFAARRLGSFYGTLAWWVLPDLRRRSLRHLALAFPEWPERRRHDIARRVPLWIGRVGTDFLHLGGRDHERLLSSIRTEGLANWSQARAGGRGIVVVTAHLGNWELLGACLATLGRPVSVLYHPFREERLDRLVRRRRQRAGLRTLAAGRSAVASLRALRRGEVLGLLADGVPRGPAVTCRFFGRECRAAPGAAWFALHGGAALVPASLVLEDGGYRLRIRPALPEPDAGAPVEERTAAWTRSIATALEDQIREAPDQWPWFYNRWKIRSRAADPVAAPPGRGLDLGRMRPPFGADTGAIGS